MRRDVLRPWWWWLALSLSTACSDPGGGDEAEEEHVQARTVVIGTVLDVGGLPLAGVEVRSGPATATTATDGTFELEAASGPAVIVKLHKAGYVRGLERIDVLDGTPTTLGAVLREEAPAIPLDADAGGEAIGIRGARIDAAPGSFVRPDGTPVGGMVDVHLTPLNPALPAEYDAYPGDGLARQEGGALVQLETFGVLDVTVRKDGEELTIADGMGVQVDFPLPDPAPAELPETVALWGFDEEAGVWEEEGVATLDLAAGVYRGTITHLSPWNCDQPISTTCISGRVVDDSGAPIAGAIVYADGVDFLGGSSATSREDGRFEVPVRKDSRIEVTSYDWGSGSAVREVASGSADTDVPPMPGDPRCVDAGDWPIVAGEGPAPWDPASCAPPSDEPAHLHADLGGAFDAQIDRTSAEGLQVCGWVVDDPAATDEPSGMTWLSFLDPGGWNVGLWFQGGGGGMQEDAAASLVVSRVDDPTVQGLGLCTIDVVRHESVAEDLWGVAGMGECEAFDVPDSAGGLSGSIDFGGLAGELDGLFPTVCCDLSMMPPPPM